MRFEFSRHRDGSPPSSFDLGDVRLTLGPVVVSSADQQPSGSMMIYLAVVHLLDGLSKVIEGGVSRFRFVGPDSSFVLDFQRRKKSVLAITAGKQTVGSAPILDVIDALTSGVVEFLSDPDNALAVDEPVAEDLETAMQRLRNSAASLR